MNLAALFVRRPIMTTLVMLSILLFGVLAYRMLPVSDLPNVDYPYVTVNASLGGANPDTMAASVATPLEKELSTIAGIESMTSSSTQGSSQIAIQFALNRNIDAAAQDVQAAIARAQRKLPAEMTTPPSYRKSNPADQPILWLTLTSPTLPMSALDEFGQTMLAQRISMVDGVAQVQVFGSQKRAVRIQLDPREMAARGVGIDEVSQVIDSQNVNMPLGSFSGPDKAATILANGQLMQAEDYLDLIVAYRSGSAQAKKQPVRLREIGTAAESVENDKQAAWYTKDKVRDRSIILAIYRQPGTNTVEVADSVKALLPTFREKLPAAVTLDVLRDSSLIIKASANDVQFTLLLTLGLVVLVIFLFLRNFTATIIPSLTLPMAVVGTFVVMYALDYSLDNLSLMALTLSVGFVVDDAIVMLENIVRHMEMGKSRMQATLDGSKEIGFTILSMTLSLAAVFIPVLFMSGLVGRLFREFAVTIGASVLVSGVVSLTLTPMLASRFLRHQHGAKHNWAYRAIEKMFDLLVRGYGWTLWQSLRHRRVTMLIAIAFLGGTVYLFMLVPKGFIPAEDRDQISIQTLAAQDISFDSLVRHHLDLANIVQADPDVDRFMCSVSAGNSGRLFLVLKPRDERTASADEIIKRLRPRLAAVPGIEAFPSNPLPITLGKQAKSTYQLTLQGTDTNDLYAYAAGLEQRVRDTSDVFLDVNTDMLLANPQYNVIIDRDQAAALGVSPRQIENALFNAYGAPQVSTIYMPNNQYQVIMELQDRYQTDPSLLSLLYVRSSYGKLVPLKAVTTHSEDVGPMQINHTGQLPSVTISFNLAPGVSLGQAAEKIDELVAQEKMPSGMTRSFAGTAQAFQDSLKSMFWLMILALVVIYVVLGILYESFYHPITILSALPFAGFGALFTLYLFHAELSVYAFVGIIMLIGLVKKNGIMMVDFAIEAQRQEGKSPMDAIHEACIVRFRPIMMTTVAALMGALPIAMGYGAGAESRQPLGLAVVGGLLFSQTLTLYVTPVFYVYMEKLVALLRGQKNDTAPVAESGQ